MIVSALSGISRSAGGIYYAVSSLYKALAQQQVNVVIFGCVGGSFKNDLGIWAPVPVVPYKAYGPLRSSLELRRLLKQSDANLVHQHGIWLDDQWAAFQWQKQTGKPMVISPHGMLDSWAVKHSAWKKKFVGWLFANESLRTANCIHALCQSEAESIRAYGLNNPIAVIPNGVDLPIFDNPKLNSSRSKEKRKLLFLGRIHPKKGLKELIEAWSMVQGGGESEWNLIIAGWDDGGHLESLRQQALELGQTWNEQEPELDSSLVSKRFPNNEPKASIHFVGPKFGEEKEKLLRSVDAFILPSFSEGLPLSVLEAWSYGLPVIMTPQCNIPVGFAMTAAIRVDPEVKSIAEGLRRLFIIAEDDLRAMGLRGRRMVEEQFTWSKIAKDMCSVYKWVIDGGTPPACVNLN